MWRNAFWIAITKMTQTTTRRARSAHSTKIPQAMRPFPQQVRVPARGTVHPVHAARPIRPMPMEGNRQKYVAAAHRRRVRAVRPAPLMLTGRECGTRKSCANSDVCKSSVPRIRTAMSAALPPGQAARRSASFSAETTKEAIRTAAGNSAAPALPGFPWRDRATADQAVPMFAEAAFPLLRKLHARRTGTVPLISATARTHGKKNSARLLRKVIPHVRSLYPPCCWRR